MNDKQRKHFFAVIAHNGNERFEKLVEAPSEEFILKNQSRYFGKGIKILDIDSSIYKNAKTEAVAYRMMRNRFGYKVVNGTRVYH